MPFRQIDIPSLGRRLSSVMAFPSSAADDAHELGLDEYRRLGGNCIHLHGEGDETHSRRATGEWLRSHRLRPEFFVCTQICHAGWDQTAGQPIDRFTPEAVTEDVAHDLDLLGTDYIDLVCLGDNPQSPFEPVIDALGREITGGRIRAFGVSSWTADRIQAAHVHARRAASQGIAAVVSTEFCLPTATSPLWPEYVPFDADLEQAVRSLGLAVFAHAADFNIGQCLFGDEDPVARMRRHWVERWDHPANPPLVQRVRHFAAARGITTREVNIAWLLNQRVPTIAVISLPTLLAAAGQYERASQLLLDDADLRSLSGAMAAVDDI